MTIYQPAEDSYLLQETLSKQFAKRDTLSSANKEIPNSLIKNANLKFLEIGIGSGIQLRTAKKLGLKNKNILGVDINLEAVKYCKKLNFFCKKSNLLEKVKGKFDFIIFNPPYLPEDKREPKESRIATTGGKLGGEIINQFLQQAKKHLEKNGKIFLLVSNLTKGIKWGNWKKKKIAEKKVFYETLKVYELRQ
ncbi:methyltransferase [archaeon]|jgi:release factor glutamine methyltransferase|nr:methyltransferase [archaeon]MBT4373593.1 methyltransferase [archaeon]MBT4532041.1 methyltransferase [archaeon]MBT7001708.1 methyltransferase [archaeon]MBT7282400.1 methyltransferase [archaeon]